ncbi:RIP metalloprotease RseP [Polycladidibacter hongkongensis]|uniref:RIP metalloprotease RseP n=1 Tax=Polycladidibacter hongkongensis TaxID=1647556 RepID=UPI0008319C4B|nr:RIP metalloprotease RseP [Pseudovibrio hongkongensis]
MNVFDFYLAGPLGVILPFLFVLTVVVFFHELGHFWVARRCGVKVLTFSVGFGPELIGRNDKLGTRWKLCAIPLGGYVKFAGDENAASMPSREDIAKMDEQTRRTAFFAKPVWQRALVVAAGPFANFLLAIVIFASMLFFFGRMETAPYVDKVMPNTAAQEAGLAAGDLIVRIDGEAIDSFSQLQRIVSASAGQALQMEVERNGELVGLEVTPRRTEVSDRFGNKTSVGQLGVQRSTTAEQLVHRQYGLGEAVVGGVKETWFVIARTGGYIGDMFTGKEDTSQLGGPIRVAQISGQVASLGFLPLLNLCAVLSVSIGLLNLLPVPVLDGGHLMFYAYEAVRGKPLDERIQEIGFRIGITLVLFLMIFASWNDLAALIGP